MKLAKLNSLITVGLVLLLVVPAQSQFVKTLGGSLLDEGACVIEGSDGEILVTANTLFGTGTPDLLLAKFDPSGNLVWTTTLGGSADDEGRCLIETSDSGFVVTGQMKGLGGGPGYLLLAKFDSSGDTIWVRTLGEQEPYDVVYDGTSVIEASDGAIIVVGSACHLTNSDLLVARFDACGNLIWVKTIDGGSSEWGTSVIEAYDGGIVVTGTTYGAGERDLLLAKFGASSNLLWATTLGGTLPDLGYSVIEASDSGLVVAGITQSFGAGDHDVLLAKFDSSGDTIWARVLGGTDFDYGMSVIEALDGGLVVTGHTESFGAGDRDLLLAKFDSSGNYLWTRLLGVNDNMDWGESVIQRSNGDLIITGATVSSETGLNLLFAQFDGSGNTCLGEFVNPSVESISPEVNIPSFTPETPPCTVTIPTPTVTEPIPTVTFVCGHEPKIVSITDVGNDQGKQVRVKWERCYYDREGSPFTITEYSLWRRIDEDKGSNQSKEILSSYLGIVGNDRLYPPGDWDFIKTVPARGESTYNTVCPTLGDSTEAEGMYWSVFFVSAMTSDPLVYYDSEPDSGYSLDNIPPLPVLDLEIDPNSWFTLQWTVPGEYPEERPISAYDIRYSTVPVGADTQAWWDSAEPCVGEGFFNFTVGGKDSLKAAEETSCHPVCYFALKGLDQRPNASGISNIVRFTCGDPNADAAVDVADVMYLINYLFIGGSPPEPMAAGDATCDGNVDIADVMYLINYLFIGGSPPCAP